MKKIVLCLVLVMPCQAWCQMNETFDDNKNRWDLTTDHNSSRKIESGKYVLTTKEKDHGKFITMPGFFNPQGDFKLEVSLNERSGVDNNGFGLFWAKMNSSTYNEFIIASTGYYIIAPKGTNSEWVKTDLVKPMGQANILRVEKRGKTVSCYLNGKRVYKDEMPGYGYGVGFLNYVEMVLAVDYFTFEQEGNEIKLVNNMPKGLVKQNLGASINTAADEVSPIISADGRTLYFGREEYEHNLGGVSDLEDVWYSNLNGTQWQTAVNLGEPANDSGVNNLASVSADNNTLIFSKGGKFMYRKRTETSWSDLIETGLSFNNEASHFEAQLASDGKAMLFTAKNSSNVYYNSNIDEKDIYVSLQDKNGKWSSPQNLGKTLNTAGNETGPFLSSDGRTLYFSSNGRPGYGDNDIFVSKRIGDGWTNWSEPLNLGPEINTSGFDAYYTLPASGDYAYLVGDQDSFGKADIFRIELPKAAKPDPVVLLSGRALNAKNNKPVEAEILLDDLATGKEVAEANSDPSTGQFKIVLQPGANYGIHAAAKGYLSVNENIELASIHEYKEMQKDLLLMPIEVGLTLALNNVFFEQGKPTLRKESYPELDRLVKIMTDNPKMQIELGGHTDNVGSGAALMKLSQDRVDAVKKYLESNSISASRITGRGYGATVPREKNDTEEHRKMNRRVEFKILKN